MLPLWSKVVRFTGLALVVAGLAGGTFGVAVGNVHPASAAAGSGTHGSFTGSASQLPATDAWASDGTNDGSGSTNDGSGGTNDGGGSTNSGS